MLHDDSDVLQEEAGAEERKGQLPHMETSTACTGVELNAQHPASGSGMQTRAGQQPAQPMGRGKGAVPAPFTLRQKFGNKSAKTQKQFDAAHMQCKYCEKKGHERWFCPLRPVPGGSDAHPYVEGLMSLPVVTWRDRKTKCSMRDAMGSMITLGMSLNRNNPWAESTATQDQLRKNLGWWKAIGANNTVLSWLAYGVRLEFGAEPAHYTFRNHPSYEAEKEFVEAEHKQHVADGSFVEVKEEEVRVGNPLQVEVNGKGKRRLCMDMRWVNSHLAHVVFTMETLHRYVGSVVQQGDRLITSDVAKAYYKLGLHRATRLYLCWQHNGKWYCPTVLVFGLAPAPLIFTKVMRPVLGFTRGMGVRVTNIIDDFLWASRPDVAHELVWMVQLLLPRLGWSFNDKCCFVPSTMAVYMGMIVDARRYEIRAPDQKVEAAKQLNARLLRQVQNGQKVTVLELQQLAGRILSMMLALDGARVWTRAIYADIAQAIQHVPRHWYVYGSERTAEELLFWSHRLGVQNGLPIREPGSEILLFCDASDVGYGGHVEEQIVRGALPVDVLGTSSTRRELVGLRLVALDLVRTLRGRRVTIHMDSSAAIRNLINGGGGKSDLAAEVKLWWQFCQQHNITARYEWIRRDKNTVADMASKYAAADAALQPAVEQRIREWMRANGLPFLGWSSTKLYVPYSYGIQLRLDAIRRSRDVAVVVVPEWPSQAWWPGLNSLCTARLRLGEIQGVLSNLADHTPRWSMVACQLNPIQPEKQHEQTKQS